MSTTEIYMICAAVVLTAMILSEGFGGCKEGQESSDELNAIQKRLDLLEAKVNER